MAFVPYIADLEKWKKHFMHMAESKTVGSGGMYIVGKTYHSGRGENDEPVVKYVTPTAQAVEQAESEIKHRKVPSKRKAITKSVSQASKRRRVKTSTKKK